VAQARDVYDRRRHLNVRDDRDRPDAEPADVQRSLPQNASLVALWHQGREQAIAALDNSRQFPHSSNFFRELSEAADNGKGVSMLRPSGVMIGSTVRAAVDEACGGDEEGEGENASDEDTLPAPATAAARDGEHEDEEDSIVAEQQVASHR
jgi:hypothetical protein